MWTFSWGHNDNCTRFSLDGLSIGNVKHRYINDSEQFAISAINICNEQRNVKKFAWIWIWWVRDQEPLGFTGFDNVTSQVHIPVKFLNCLFLKWILPPPPTPIFFLCIRFIFYFFLLMNSSLFHLHFCM